MVFYLRRIAFYLVTLWAAISLNFLLPRMMPGDPAKYGSDNSVFVVKLHWDRPDR